jgi:hypothetical protein
MKCLEMNNDENEQLWQENQEASDAVKTQA